MPSFKLNRAPAIYVSYFGNGKAETGGDGKPRRSRMEIQIDVLLKDKKVIKACEAIIPDFVQQTNKIAADEKNTGLDTKPRSKLPLSTIEIYARGPNADCEFTWVNSEPLGKPAIHVNKDGEGVLVTRWRVQMDYDDNAKSFTWKGCDIALSTIPTQTEVEDAVAEAQDKKTRTRKKDDQQALALAPDETLPVGEAVQ